MEYYAGINVSLEQSSICVVGGGGKIIGERKVASDPPALIEYFGSLRVELARIGLEAGPLSQWLYAALKAAGMTVELLETRHVHDAFSAMPVKSDRDRNDARGIAQLMGWAGFGRCIADRLQRRKCGRYSPSASWCSRCGEQPAQSIAWIWA